MRSSRLLLRPVYQTVREYESYDTIVHTPRGRARRTAHVGYRDSGCRRGRGPAERGAEAGARARAGGARWPMLGVKSEVCVRRAGARAAGPRFSPLFRALHIRHTEL